jgi:hypothetical protein
MLIFIIRGKPILLIINILFAILLFQCNSLDKKTIMYNYSDEKIIKDLYKKFCYEWEINNLSKMMELFSDNFLHDNNNKESYRQQFKDLGIGKSINWRVIFEKIEVTKIRDYAETKFNYIVYKNGVIIKQGDSYNDEARILVYLKKENNEWKFIGNQN